MSAESQMLALQARLDTKERYRKRTKGKELPTDHSFGFTIICNNCGSTNVAMPTTYQHGEMTGFALDCQNPLCKQKVRY